MKILFSILFGAIPEMFFVAYFIIGAKAPSFKDRKCRLKLAILYILAYSIAVPLLQFNTWFHIILVAVMYIILKILKPGTEGIDLFLLTIPYALITVTGYICRLFYLSIGYSMAYIMNRIILLFIIVALYPHLNKWYNAFKRVWNRNPNNKIKSITVRNILIVGTNILIMLLDFVLQVIRKGGESYALVVNLFLL